jgi:nucleoside-diphosphate-sugar epimerase
MTRLLITGASGFIGRHVLAHLPPFSEVHAVSRTAPKGLCARSIAWHGVDLRDARAAVTLVERLRPTHLLHLAWNAEHGVFWTASDNEQWADATIRMADAFVAGGGQRFVGAGTCAEYDWTALDGPCREDATPLDPRTPYGRAKLRAWRHIESATSGAGTTAAWGRIFLLYGPGEDDRRLVPSIADALREGRRAAVTEGTQVRDFLHVSDVARAFTTLLSADVRGAVNIGSGEPVSVRRVVETLSELAGRPDLIDFGAIPMRADDPPVLVADAAKLRDIGWSPRISLRDGLKSVVKVAT